MDIKVRRDLMTRISETNYENFHHFPEATYTSWLTNDVNTINDYGFSMFFFVTNQIANIVLSIFSLLTFHYSLLITVAVLTGIMLLAPKLFTRRLNQRSVAQTKMNEELTKQVTDVLEGFNSLFTLGLPKTIQTKTLASSQKLADARIDYAKTAGSMSATVNIVSLLSQIAVLVHAALLFMAHLIPAGAVSNASYFASTIFTSLTGATANIAEMSAVQPIFDKYEQLPINTDDQKCQSVTPLENQIAIQNLNFAYDQQQPVLQNFSWRIQKNKKYALVGDSGSGKSTILNLLVGQLTHYSGQIRYDGQDYQRLDLQSLRRQISFLEQSPHVFNASLRENILLGREITESQLRAIIERAGLNQLIAKLPQGLDSILTHNGQDLSGGQKQRISLVRGLVNGAEIMLLDEATTSLDQRASDDIEQNLLDDPQLTLVIVTHHLHEKIAAQLHQVLQI